MSSTRLDDAFSAIAVDARVFGQPIALLGNERNKTQVLTGLWGQGFPGGRPTLYSLGITSPSYRHVAHDDAVFFSTRDPNPKVTGTRLARVRVQDGALEQTLTGIRGPDLGFIFDIADGFLRRQRPQRTLPTLRPGGPRPNRSHTSTCPRTV